MYFQQNNLKGLLQLADDELESLVQEKGVNDCRKMSPQSTFNTAQFYKRPLVLKAETD